MRSGIRSSIATSVRTARLDRGWTQSELAEAAGVSRSLVSAVETGSRDCSLDALERVADGLAARLVVELRAPLVVGGPGQRDAAHSLCVTAARQWLERRGWQCVVELPIVDGRIRGWIDLLAFDPLSGRLMVIEVKTELRDLGGLQRQVGWYARDAVDATAGLGWRPREVVVLVIFLATTDNDDRLSIQRDAITATFPVRGRALDRALAGGPYPGWGVAMIDPRRRGSRRWIGLRLDGRRVAAPYTSYSDFMRAARRSRQPRAGDGDSTPPVIRRDPERGNSAKVASG